MASEAEKTFKRFAVFGESSSSGVEINNKNFSKLCKDCGIMDGKMVTSTDVDIVFSKVKDKNARTITFPQFQEAMKELGQKRFKGKNPDETLENIYKLMEGKDPATPGVTKATTVGGVSRLTDTSKYTGSHKERFDESGKGKGIAGREERSENSGYVSAYKGAGTFDKKKKESHQTITVALETLWVVNLGIVNVHGLKVLDGNLYADVHDQSWSLNKLEEQEPGHSWCHSSCW
ncbi:Tubulin polymerization-promoting protein family member 2 [Myotis davidii]|uniref:Tubulin polymerization-promoting protein family member 2 n=1 Tax=Myotis davidii TaxID=225400 RepID=L5LBP9_MYODS|nr:Tubulin polymerization-promoting protein family member 2 [Myotis davidii]